MSDKVTVSSEALRKVLEAFLGPHSRVLELQITMKLDEEDHPVNKLISEFNESLQKTNDNRTPK